MKWRSEGYGGVGNWYRHHTLWTSYFVDWVGMEMGMIDGWMGSMHNIVDCDCASEIRGERTSG